MKLGGSEFNIINNIYSGSAPKITGGSELFYFEYIKKNELKQIEEPSPPEYVLTGRADYSQVKIYETCHGVNYTSISDLEKLGKYNFYHAPYGAGYYHPPVGEFPTIAEDIGENRVQPPDKKEYLNFDLEDRLKIFGLRITKNFNNFLSCKTYPLLAFHEGVSDCPIEKKPSIKYKELLPVLSAGSFVGSIGGNIYNHNPFPSSYDRGVAIYNSNYELIHHLQRDKCYYKSDTPGLTGPIGDDNTDPNVPDDGSSSAGEGGQPIPTTGKPIPTFPRGGNILSNNHAFGRCNQGLSELDRQPLSIGAVDPHYDSVLPQSPAPPIQPGQLGQDTSNYDQSVYWNFIFKNNHETLPFGNTHETEDGMYVNQDFERENHWWEHRECPENIDYLNHAYGNNLNACPSNYLDIPYYASLGKFGYFGARFQSTWRALDMDPAPDGDLDYPIGTIPLGQIRPPIPPVNTDAEYESQSQRVIDEGKQTEAFHSLLRNAALLKLYSFSMTDQTLFLNLNYDLIIASNAYKTLVNALGSNWKRRFDALKDSARYDPNLNETDIKRGLTPDFFDDPIKIFLENSFDFSAQRELFVSQILNKYGYFKLDPQGNIDNDWYAEFNRKKREKIATDYYMNIFKGKPVDLFPMGEITFSFEEYKDYANSDVIKLGSLKSIGQAIPSVKRSYFSSSLTSDLETQRLKLKTPRPNNPSSFGSYSALMNDPNLGKPFGVNVDGKILQFVEFKQRLYVRDFYAGWVNPREVAENFNIPSAKILHLINLPTNGPPFINQGQVNQGPSVWITLAPETNPPHISVIEANEKSPVRNFLSSLANYNQAEINKRYSCFSPLILQQPRKETVKYSQAPKFRVYALDYHSIPEEKIREARHGAYPEIKFWLNQLKLVSKKGENLYPLKYKWFRVKKDNADKYWKTKDESLLDPQNPSGLWCCAEHDGPDCTVIQPLKCEGLDKKPIKKWDPSENSEESCTKFMGPTDDRSLNGIEYLYFCRIFGRFGWRDSEFAEIEIEKKATLTFAYINTMNPFFLKIKIAGVEHSLQPKTAGLIPDKEVYFEQVKLSTWNDNNNCTKVQHIGPEAVRGITRVWSPGTMADPRGKKLINTRWREFGELVDLEITDLSVLEALFSNRALPYCDRQNRRAGEGLLYNGVPITLENFVHRTAIVPAVFSSASKFGVRAERLRNIQELYPTVSDQDYAEIGSGLSRAFPFYNRGHGQFDENLGCIKKYSMDGVDAKSVIDTLANGSFNEVEGPQQDYLSHWPLSRQATLDKIQNLSPSMAYNLGKDFGLKRVQTNPPGLGQVALRATDRVPYVFNAHMGFLFETGRSSLRKNNSKTESVQLDMSRGVALSDLTKKGNLTISGPECGYIHPSMGRLVHFYVETFDTYYSLCEVGGIKPKKVKNQSHIAGGLRSGRPGLQYSFVGRPNDSRLKWTSMPGPYAFQWKVERHNRDRNGNGMPLCFWSYNFEERIENFYDAAAVYGAVRKMKNIGRVLTKTIGDPYPYAERLLPISIRTFDIREIRAAAANPLTDARREIGSPLRTLSNVLEANGERKNLLAGIALRNVSIGPDDGRKLGCGAIRWKHEPDRQSLRPSQEFVYWMEEIAIPASADPMNCYGCDNIKNRNCFLPCISLKYPEGFSPRGGKSIGYKTNADNNSTSSRFSSTILNVKDLAPINDYFKPKLDGLSNNNIYPTQLSPCLSNKRDTCNYLTPTIHIGIDTFPTVGKDKNGDSKIDFGGLLGSADNYATIIEGLRNF